MHCFVVNFSLLSLLCFFFRAMPSKMIIMVKRLYAWVYVLGASQSSLYEETSDCKKLKSVNCERHANNYM